jgi:acetylornithine/succinyldiaminopimelate/putrescine aminotransferase
MMDRPKYKEGFGPFLDNFTILPHNDTAALRANVGPGTVAVFLEFIQGEGGVVPASEEFVAAIAELKKRHGFLLVADEIQSGLGRTGLPFAFNHYPVEPDIVVVAKPLGGGLPLGAILGADTVAGVLDVGQHGTTFGGNPVSCAAGIVVMQEIFESGLMGRAEKAGAHFLAGLAEIRKAFPSLVFDVRGKGLMIGMELTRPGDPIVAEMLAEGVLANCTNQNVIRFIPPLIITTAQVDDALTVIRRVLARHAG